MRSAVQVCALLGSYEAVTRTQYRFKLSHHAVKARAMGRGRGFPHERGPPQTKASLRSPSPYSPTLSQLLGTRSTLHRLALLCHAFSRFKENTAAQNTDHTVHVVTNTLLTGLPLCPTLSQLLGTRSALHRLAFLCHAFNRFKENTAAQNTDHTVHVVTNTLLTGLPLCPTLSQLLGTRSTLHRLALLCHTFNRFKENTAAQNTDHTVHVVTNTLLTGLPLCPTLSQLLSTRSTLHLV
ncbi:hypothetical protein J6590_047616 [Homalodisca vitripennis]|nr:hypothetical protein J6590_047616 [Homalodisca vitripennis]